MFPTLPIPFYPSSQVRGTLYLILLRQISFFHIDFFF